MSQPANDEFSQHLSDEESNHEEASDTGAAPKQQQMIPQTTAISNIKLPILKKEEYDIWAMEMEHYLEYIDNEVWKVIQNGNSKKRISTGKDGIVRVLSPVTAAESFIGGSLIRVSTPKEAYDLIENMTQHLFQWDAKVYHDTTTDMSAQYSKNIFASGEQVEVLRNDTGYTIQSIQHPLGPCHPNTFHYSYYDESDVDKPLEVLQVHKSINPLCDSPTPSPDLVVESLSPSLTPCGDSDLLLEETEAFLSLDDSIPPGLIPINRGLIQAIPTSLPPQPIGEATKASNLQRILPGV
ncbi:hypothetical protein Tco_1526006 [Tanacetum coccineum]